jgi:hypothetical protein
VLAGLLALQFLGGLGVLVMPAHEVFPLFSWFLFPLTPNSPQVRPVLQLEEYQGHRYEPACPMESVREVVPPAQAPTVVRLAQDLARAVAAGDEKGIALARQKLETNFLTGTGRYALAELSYDPIERLHGGPERARTLREFKIGIP